MLIFHSRFRFNYLYSFVFVDCLLHFVPKSLTTVDNWVTCYKRIVFVYYFDWKAIEFEPSNFNWNVKCKKLRPKKREKENLTKKKKTYSRPPKHWIICMKFIESANETNKQSECKLKFFFYTQCVVVIASNALQKHFGNNLLYSLFSLLLIRFDYCILVYTYSEQLRN